jgi:hypothetical protein
LKPVDSAQGRLFKRLEPLERLEPTRRVRRFEPFDFAQGRLREALELWNVWNHWNEFPDLNVGMSGTASAIFNDLNGAQQLNDLNGLNLTFDCAERDL